MKKVFLLLSLAGGYGLAAQQADLIDLGEKIRQRVAKEKTRMLQFDFRGDKDQPLLVNGDGLPQNFQGKPAFTLPNQDQVWVLPIDHMPCVVPDMNLFQAMPVAGLRPGIRPPKQPGMIPNPVRPVQ